MKNISIIIVSLALLFSLTACDEDSFTQVVEVDIPAHESAIVLNGVWATQDTAFSLLVSNSLGIIDRDDYTYPEDAIVKLYKNDVLLSDLIFAPDYNLYTLPEDILINEEGASYKIEAQFGTLKAVSATQVMPSKVEITDAEYEAEGAAGEFGERMDQHIISFNDPADEDNYYAIKGYRETTYNTYDPSTTPPTIDTITEFQSLYLASTDPTVSFSPIGLIVSDKAFNGQTYNLRATSYLQWGEQGNIFYELSNISKESYLYFRSLEAYSNAQNNPFAEPATVYSNVTDGYGIFGLMASDTISVTP